MSPNLTERQREVFAFLKKFHKMFSYMPTTRDIQDHFKFGSQTAAVNHLNALARKGWIERTSSKARAIRLLRDLDSR